MRPGSDLGFCIGNDDEAINSNMSWKIRFLTCRQSLTLVMQLKNNEKKNEIYQNGKMQRQGFVT